MSFAKSFFTPRKSYKFCPEKSTCLFPKVRGITSLHYTAVSVQCDPWLLTMLKLKISYALKLPTWKRQHYPPTGPTFSLKNLQIQIYSSVCIYIKMYKQHVQTAPLKFANINLVGLEATWEPWPTSPPDILLMSGKWTQHCQKYIF